MTVKYFENITETIAKTIFTIYKNDTMKKILTLILTVLTIGHFFGQTNKNGNPVFNSITTGERNFEDITLISNYYTLKNNIENSLSSVFISENPTLDQIEYAATTLSSDFFILTKDQRSLAMVVLNQNPKREFMIIEMKTGHQSTSRAKLKGTITENRAREIIKEAYDPTAFIKNGTLTFNGKEFMIIPNQEIEKAVLELIRKEKLDKKEPSDFILLSPKQIEEFILSETKENGRLDFFTEIKGHEYDAVQIKPGVFTTKQSVAFYKWGRACYELGVNTIEDTYKIFEKFQNEPLNKRDMEYIKMGFYKEWEK